MTDNAEILRKIDEKLNELNDYVRIGDFEASASEELKRVRDAMIDIQRKQERILTRLNYLAGFVGLVTGLSVVQLFRS